ncbi:MAG TPA: undecaprenyl-diphosphate phosphatase [Pirellulales bacterium]|nr:undecaprenyl-diphosphate phosphatase [Pirellulales bacterium]
MEYLRIIILGVVQGITEFLPISSDGHLVVADRLFGLANGEEFAKGDLLETIILHLGTLFSILVIYWRRILRLLTTDRRVIGLLIAGTVPAGVVGIVLEEYFKDWMTNPTLTGAMLLINGAVLLWINRRGDGPLAYQQLSYAQTLAIGACQAAAPLPGISRSGTTIAGGLAVGLRRDDAATFSFLLAVPAISGAVGVALLKLAKGAAISSPPGTLAVGAVVSFFVGLVSLRLLLKVLNSSRLHWFGWWCMALGSAVLVWQLSSGRLS